MEDVLVEERGGLISGWAQGRFVQRVAADRRDENPEPPEMCGTQDGILERPSHYAGGKCGER